MRRYSNHPDHIKNERRTVRLSRFLKRLAEDEFIQYIILNSNYERAYKKSWVADMCNIPRKHLSRYTCDVQRQLKKYNIELKRKIVVVHKND